MMIPPDMTNTMMGWRSLPRIDWREHWQNPPNTDLQLTKKYMVHHGPLIHWDPLSHIHQSEWSHFEPSGAGSLASKGSPTWLWVNTLDPAGDSTQRIFDPHNMFFLDVFGFLVIYANHIHSSPIRGGFVWGWAKRKLKLIKQMNFGTRKWHCSAGYHLNTSPRS